MTMTIRQLYMERMKRNWEEGEVERTNGEQKKVDSLTGLRRRLNSEGEQSFSITFVLL